MEVVIGRRVSTNWRKLMRSSAAAGRLQAGNARASAPTLNRLEGFLLRLGVHTQRRRPREVVLEFDAMHNPLRVRQDKTFSRRYHDGPVQSRRAERPAGEKVTQAPAIDQSVGAGTSAAHKPASQPAQFLLPRITRDISQLSLCLMADKAYFCFILPLPLLRI